jgi:hypothetical protein
VNARPDPACSLPHRADGAGGEPRAAVPVSPDRLRVREDPSGRPGSGLLWARLDLGDGRRLTVVWRTRCRRKRRRPRRSRCTGTPDPRDAEIAYVKAFVDARSPPASGRAGGRLQRHRAGAGDAELSPRAARRHDVAWAPARPGDRCRAPARVALIRIDRILAGPGQARPRSTRTARSAAATIACCTRPSRWAVVRGPVVRGRSQGRSQVAGSQGPRQGRQSGAGSQGP